MWRSDKHISIFVCMKGVLVTILFKHSFHVLLLLFFGGILFYVLFKYINIKIFVCTPSQVVDMANSTKNSHKSLD